MYFCEKRYKHVKYIFHVFDMLPYDAATVTILNVYIILMCFLFAQCLFVFFNSAQLF